MKLLTYDPGTGPRAGVLDGEDVVDASALLGSATTLRDVRALVEFGPDAVDRLRDALSRVSASRVPLANVKLRAPVLQPPTVRDHIAFEEHATGQWTPRRPGPAWRTSTSVRKGYPARWLQPGDVVEMEVDGIGTLRNTLGLVTNPNRNLRFTAPTQRGMPEPLPAEDLQRVRERTAPREGVRV